MNGKRPFTFNHLLDEALTLRLNHEVPFMLNIN